MKISKSKLLNLSLMFTALGLGLMAVSTAERQLYLNIDNASHYMENVKLISSGSEYSATLKQIGSGSVKIQTPNFILSKTGFNKENSISTGFYSSILGGIKNRIEGELGETQVLTNVIFGGSGNLISGHDGHNMYNVILGGESNKIEDGSNSVILGGKNNEIKGNYNVILGSNNKIEESSGSVIVGDNSYVNGNYSAALGSGSKVEANNSFLRNDGSAETTLTKDNIFVIMAKSGMVINSGKPHNYAKLTLGGPLIISSKDSDANIKCGEGEGGGILKMVDTGNQVCLCGCDGWSRNSMLGKGNCTKACNQDIAPVCGDIVTKEISELHYYFSGSCNSGKVVEGTGAYLVTRDDKVHRSCQTDDGQVVGCSGFANNGYGSCAGSHATGHGVILGNSNYIISLSPGVTTWHYDISQTPGTCEWTCNINSGFTVNDAHDKCICPTGYQLSEDGQSCENAYKYPCEGTEPGSNTTSGGNMSTTSNKEWKYIDNWGSSLGTCEWRCRNNSYVRSGNKCIIPTGYMPG